VSLAVLICIIALVFGFGGIEGVILMTISTGLGLIPPLFRTRRLNMIIGFFFPIFLNMCGMRADVLKILGVY
jgi:TctA family transporter